MDAIILAGGKGTRLQDVIKNIPKPLAPINGIPFLDFLVDFLKKQKEIKKIILSVGYEKQQIINRYKNFENIFFSQENTPLGTGGALKKALKLIDSENVLVLNGDTFIEYNLSDFNQFHLSKNSDISILLNYQKDLSRFGSVTFEKKTHKILSFNEKIDLKDGYINSGVYIFNKYVLNCFDLPKNFSLEQDFFPKIIKIKNIFGYPITSKFIDIGIKSSYLEAQDFFI